MVLRNVDVHKHELAAGVGLVRPPVSGRDTWHDYER